MSRQRQLALAVLVAVPLAVGPAGVAAAGGVQPAYGTVSLSPASQTGSFGQTLSWKGTWTGMAPFTGSFCYGDGGCLAIDTIHDYQAFFHAFHPCYTTTYTQVLTIDDATTDEPVETFSTATVDGGSPC